MTQVIAAIFVRIRQITRKSIEIGRWQSGSRDSLVRAKIAVCLLAGLAILELGVAAYAALIGGFHLEFGVLRVSSSDAWKPFTVGVLCASVAVWVFDRQSGLLSRLEVSVRTARLLVVCGIVAALIPLITPLLVEPGFAFGHDIAGHATYTYLFDRALKQGQFPVRWVEWIQHGNGQPLFNYYQVGLYYLVECVHLLVPSLSFSLKLTVALLWAGGAVFMFLLFKRYGWSCGAIAAVVFAWSRYLMLDGYVRAAYPELAAIGLAPGVLWSLDRFSRTGRSAFLSGFALLSVVLTICHPPTALIVGPVCAAYVLYLWCSRQSTARRLWLIVPAAALSAGMTAFYTWPALWENDIIKIETLTKNPGLDYHNHFVYPKQWLQSTWWYGASVAGPNDQMSFRVGRIQWLSIACAVVLVGASIATRRITTRTRDLAWWLGVTAFALYMTTHASVPVWEAFPALSFVLFPWRYMMLVAIACGAMAGITLSTVKRRTSRVLILICIVVIQGYFTRDARRLTRDFLILFSEKETPRVVMNIDDPNWRETDNAREMAFIERIYDPSSAAHVPPAAAGRWRVSGGTGEIRGDVIKDHQLSLAAFTNTGMRLTIYSRYVPGWTTWLDGQQSKVAVDPNYGYMELDVPVGRHRIDVRFTDTWSRRWANVLSVISTIIWIGWTGIAVRRRSRVSFPVHFKE